MTNWGGSAEEAGWYKSGGDVSAIYTGGKLVKELSPTIKYCPRPNHECSGACKPPGCAKCPQCGREFYLEVGEAPGALCCICKATSPARGTSNR